MSNPDYSQGKIYKLIDQTTGKSFIGSTTGPLEYTKMFYDRQALVAPILQNSNYTVELIEMFPCNDKDELRSREKFHRCMEECVNHIPPKPQRTPAPRQPYQHKKPVLLPGRK